MGCHGEEAWNEKRSRRSGYHTPLLRSNISLKFGKERVKQKDKNIMCDRRENREGKSEECGEGR